MSDMLREAEEQVTKVTADLNGMPGSPSKNPHKFDYVADISFQVEEMVDRKYQALSDVLAVIKQIPDDKVRTVMIARYGNLKRWDEISYDMGWEPEAGYARRLCREGIGIVTEILNGIDGISV